MCTYVCITYVHFVCVPILYGICTCFLSPQLGGTIGDIEGMPFIEAFRQFQFKVGVDNFCNIHVSLIPEVSIRPLPFTAWGGGCT